MSKDGGFVKIYRSMLNWEWHDDPITMATWMYCLMRANYETQRWHGQIVKPGQFVTSLAHMAKDIGISVRQLRTALNHLKSTHELTQTATSRATLITIEKWALYQSAGEKATQRATSEVTSNRQATDKQPTTIEEREESKEREEREINNKEMDESAYYLKENHERFKAIKEALTRGEFQ